jgi:hypothetical protein
MAELDGLIGAGRNVFFAHTMAGGIPKAKVFMVIANRIYKGRATASCRPRPCSTATWAS